MRSSYVTFVTKSIGPTIERSHDGHVRRVSIGATATTNAWNQTQAFVVDLQAREAISRPRRPNS